MTVKRMKFDMKLLPFAHASRTPGQGIPLRFNGNGGLYAEGHFNDMLSLERKRTERSGKPFMLMLADMKKIRHPKERSEAVKKVTAVLSILTRETDLKGWYRKNAVFGIIFTEMNGMEKEVLQNKIHKHVSAVLTARQIRNIVITFHVFPKDDNKQERLADLTIYPDLQNRSKHRKVSRFIKRTIDIVGSLAGIIIFLPVFLVVPLIIKSTSPGPVFFRQERMGLYGQRFIFLKFRTMYRNNNQAIHEEYIKKFISGRCEDNENEKDNGGKKTVFKITDDKRVNGIGKFLRKTSMDEIPQFINVLRGEMSLVGPRPPIPYEVEQYAVWHRRRVIEVKPGITGLWQVKGRSSTTFDEMVRLDLQYSRQWSIWLDIKILLKTPRAVLSGKGAY